MPSPLSVQPIADFRLTLVPNHDTGEVQVDLGLTNAGDLAVVTGIDRLVQTIVLWLLTPQGQDPWDPGYGNPYYLQLGRPSTAGAEQEYHEMLDACEQAFLAGQDQAAQAGQLTADEMVDHFEDNQVSFLGPGQVVVSFTVVARSGTLRALNLPFAASLSAGQAS